MLNVDDPESLKMAVMGALTEVYKNEYYLIEHRCHELTVVAAFFYSFRLHNQIADNRISIDMEYSRFGETLEAKPASPNTYGKKHMRIDFVVHQRGVQENNKLAIEFKDANSKKDIAWDYEKLKSITVRLDDSRQIRNYGLGLSVKYNKDGVTIVSFTDGEERVEEVYVWNVADKSFTKAEIVNLHCKT